MGESLRGLIQGNHSVELLKGIAQSRRKPPSTSEAEQSTLNNLRRELLKIYEHNKRAAPSEPQGRRQYYYILDQERRASSRWRGTARSPIRCLSPKRSADGRADGEADAIQYFSEAPPEQKFGHGLSEVGMIMAVSGVLVHLTFLFTTSVSTPSSSSRAVQRGRLQCAKIPVNVWGGMGGIQFY